MKCLFCNFDAVYLRGRSPKEFYICKHHKQYLIGIDQRDYYWIACHGFQIIVNYTNENTSLIEFVPIKNSHLEFLSKNNPLTHKKYCYVSLFEKKILFLTNEIFDVTPESFNSYVKKFLKLRMFV